MNRRLPLVALAGLANTFVGTIQGDPRINADVAASPVGVCRRRRRRCQ